MNEIKISKNSRNQRQTPESYIDQVHSLEVQTASQGKISEIIRSKNLQMS